MKAKKLCISNFANSIRGKSLIYLIVVIIVPFLCTTTLQNVFVTKQLKKISINNTKQVIHQVETLTTQYFEDIISLINTLSENENLLRFSKGDSNDNIKKDIEYLFKTIKNNYPQIAGILIVNSKDEYISNDLYRRFNNPIIADNWYKSALEMEDGLAFFSKPVRRNLAAYQNYAADEVISIARVIKGDSLDSNAVLLLDIKLKSLEDNLKSIKIGTDGFVYILDENNETIFAPDNDIVYRIKHGEILSQEEGGSVIKVRGNLYQSLYKAIPGLNWNVIGIFSLENVYGVVRTLQWGTGIVITIMLAIIAVAAKDFDKRFTKPILKLNETMQAIENGNLNVRFDYESNDEIGALGNSFNSMILEVTKLRELVELEREKARQAEFRIMQSQINPHFLYNTLDTIRWIAKDYNAKEIEDIVLALTKLFRITLNNGNELISVDDEIKHVENYLIIQKMCYEDLFEYKIEVDEEIRGNSVIRLILQPIVENAIYHGIKEGNKKGFIEIVAKKEDDDIVIYVKDNGAGLTSNKVEEINNMFRTRKRTIGFGLYNINERITHRYGEGYGLTIESVKDEYTVVTLVHPIIKGEKNENSNCR